MAERGAGSGTPEERNLRVYAIYLPLSRIYFFAPVYFLYFIARFDLAEVLLLGSIYYVSVVVFELPSGYLSDRVGRVAALRLSAIAMSVSYALFLTGGDHFVLFACAQVLLGLGYASISGTDTSFHYDALVAAGRESSFEVREERLTRDGYVAGGVGALAAGAVAQVDLAFAYGLCLANAVLLLLLTLGLREPTRGADGFATRRPAAQLRACVDALRDPHLGWLFAFGIVMVTLAHLPAEFAQPYLAHVLGDDVKDVSRTPIAAGALVGANTLLAAWAAASSLRLRARAGVAAALLGTTLWQVGLLAAMAAVIHPVVALGLLTRSFLPAVSRVIVAAEVAPRLHPSLRASYLSLDSLAGRLGYAGVLAGLAFVAGPGGTADPIGLARVLWMSAALGAAGWGVLLLARGALARDPTVR